MIINDVTIENFRCYYGKNDIHFNKDGKITLIFGDSGYGKSSFLQFFRWMFYGDPDFGPKDDKPLFNATAFNNSSFGSFFNVSGKVDFEHMGVRYSLVKSLKYNVPLKAKDARVEESIYSLLILENDSWYEYKGDVKNKINTILPKGLSKYFLLDGEKARDIVLNPKELQNAIHSIFGLDAYANALSHIGNKSKKNSVLGLFNSQMASKMSQSTGNMNVEDWQSNVQDLYEEIEKQKERKRQVVADINEKNARRDEILKDLGAATNKNTLNQLIKANSDAIARNENQIKENIKKLGDLYYRWYPYLFLSRLTTSSSSYLREKNASFAKTYSNVFENLKKDLLKEIRDRGVCVCGRDLDDESKKYIDDIISVMPPDSYAYQFGQFVSKARKQIQSANIKLEDYESIQLANSNLEKENRDLELDTKDKMDELKRFDQAKELVDELENIKTALINLSKQRSALDGDIAKKTQIYDIGCRKLSDALKNSKVSKEYSSKIEFFENVKSLLEAEKYTRELDVRNMLNLCVRDVFKKLTTQNDLDADKIQFINDDFSLRTTFLTGGQLAVDVYSYVIGIIKALKEFKMDNNENPIIIDAPFAFTGNLQSEHIFKTLPTISSQNVLLTLDVNKIKPLLANRDMYDLYIISNKSQEKASFRILNENEFIDWESHDFDGKYLIEKVL